MNSIIQHIPTFCEGFIKETIEFSSTDDLLNIDFVKSFSKDYGFSRYELSEDCLMAIYDDGFRWWVIGRIDKPEEVNLPKWKGGKYCVLLDGKEKVILGDEVNYTQGEDVVLCDGRKGIRIRKM